MNVASIELCRELYELSGWRDLRDWWWGDHQKGGEIRYRLQQNAPLDKCGRDDVPAYDLGYLLRKLPDEQWGEDKWFNLQLETDGVGWLAGYAYGNETLALEGQASTPEDAVTILAIQLFKQGVLTRRES